MRHRARTISPCCSTPAARRARRRARCSRTATSSPTSCRPRPGTTGSTTRGEGRYLLVIPYFHIYAFTVGMMCGVWVGGLQIILPKYDVEQVLRRIRDFRPTYFPAVPTIFVSLLAHPKVKEYGLEQRAHVQQRRRAVSGRSDGGVRAPHRPHAERGLRAVGNVAGHAFDAAAGASASPARSACRCPTPT